MKHYNHSLDYTVLALAAAADGKLVTAGKLLVKASQQHDVKAAVAIIEASNAQAFEALTASKKVAAKAKTTKVKAGTRVCAFDIGDEDEIKDLIDDARGDEDDAEHDLDEDEDHDEVHAAEEEEEEVEFDTAFASMLRDMKGASKPKRK